MSVESSNNKNSSENLLNKLKSLKLIIESPRNCLNNYITNIRNEINLYFSSRTNSEQNNEKRVYMKRIWLELVDRVDSYERECLRKLLLVNKFVDDLRNCNEIESKILSREGENLDTIIYNELNKQIEKLETSIRKNLFGNRTILFLKDYTDFLNKDPTVKLVILFDECFSEEAIQILKQIYEDKNKIASKNRQQENEDGVEEDEEDNNDADDEEDDEEESDEYEEENVFQEKLSIVYNDDDDEEFESTTKHEDIEMEEKKDPIKDKLTNEKLKIRELKRKLIITNHIAWVSIDSLYNLKSLKLHFNEITSVEETAFENITNIRDLWLHFNLINHIDEKAFSNLINLNNIKLNNNQLSILHFNLFQNLSNLKVICLNHNQIEVIHEKTFKGLICLKELWLNDNNLYKIENNLFEDLINLEILFLNNNKINQIDVNTFQKLSKLQVLNLAYNQIKMIDKNSLQGLINLQILELNNNQLVKIEKDLFGELKSLKVLLLNSNKIEEIEDGTFENRTYRLLIFDNPFIRPDDTKETLVKKKKRCRFSTGENI